MTDWSGYIKELEEFDWSVLESGFRINGCETIVDPEKFVRSHLDVVRANNGRAVGKPYMRRLWGVYQELKRLKTE